MDLPCWSFPSLRANLAAAGRDILVLSSSLLHSHTPNCAKKDYFTPFYLLGNVQSNPLLLGQRRGIFMLVIKAVV